MVKFFIIIHNNNVLTPQIKLLMTTRQTVNQTSLQMLPALQHHLVTNAHTHNRDAIGNPCYWSMQQCACVWVNVMSACIDFIFSSVNYNAIYSAIFGCFIHVYILLYYKLTSHCIHVYTLHTHACSHTACVCVYICMYVCMYICV
jgi:hypothetical protein